MGFTFFYPLFWLGALAALVPVWLHLRRREDPNTVKFSALRFLDDQPVARRSPLWPQNWPLLFLRMLALLLLVGAFAWPYLPEEQDVVIEESRVYILDNTLSHQRNSGFEKARDQIADELASAGIETQIAVVELTATPRVLVGFGDSPQAAAETVRHLKPSAQRGSYLAGFRLAAGMLDQSLGKDRKIVLLSDNQANQWSESLQSTPFLENIEIELPERPSEAVVNWSVRDPQIRRVEIGEEVFAECVYTVIRQGNETKATVIVEADGGEVGRQSIQLPKATQSIALAATWPTDPENWLAGAIRVESENDQLSGDNRTVFSLKPVREGQLGVLVDSNYLKIALSPEILSGRWKPHGLTREELANRNGSPELPEFDALCLESQFLTSAPVRELVLDQLNQGRGVVLFVDRVTPVIAGFLRELGVESEPGDVSLPKPAGFQYAFLEHPIFTPFRSADFGDVTEITVSHYRSLKMPNSLQLAFSSEGDPLIFDSKRTKGRLLLFGLTMDRSDTNWPLDPTMIPFLDRCFDHVRSEPDPPTAYQPGETFRWRPRGEQKLDKLVLKPSKDNSSKGISPDVQNDEARFPLPNEPGHYELRYIDTNELVMVLDVNPPPEESVLNYQDGQSVVQSWQKEPTNKNAEQSGEEPDWDLSTMQIFRQQLWWWLLLLGFAAILIETIWVSFQTQTT